MSAALLPPDPTREASYWLSSAFGDVSVEWVPSIQSWTDNGVDIDPTRMAGMGYTLASIHPIPTAAQLDALWGLVKQFEDVESAMANKMGGKDFEWGRGEFAGHAAHVLRAALKGDAP